jgi:aminomethyltransferase
MTEPLKRTSLYDRHRAAGARMVAFAGWEMPAQYQGVLDEHRAVRERAGLFDVSHMGTVELYGPDAAATCQLLTTNDVRRLKDGRAQYSILCNERGGMLDDIIVYRRSPEHYLLCVNAANTAADVAWIQGHATKRVEVVDRSAETALLALQGPRAGQALAPLARDPVGTLPAFGCVDTQVAGVPALVARTGYTGEDGFELFAPAALAGRLWDALLGGAEHVAPAGLGARDVLRLEAGLLLHGVDMGPETSPFEVGLGWVVKLDAEPFVGREALMAEARRDPSRRLAALVLAGPGVPRHCYPISRDGRRVGAVTSGTLSPTLRKGIALGMVDCPHDALGTRLAVEIRQRTVDAEVVRRPFYSRRLPRAPGSFGHALDGEASS